MSQNYHPAFEKDEEVFKTVPPKGAPKKFTIFECIWNGDESCYMYKLVDKQRELYAELRGWEEIVWFVEAELDPAWWTAVNKLV